MAGTGNTSVRSYNFYLDTTVQGAGTYAENGPHNFIDASDGTLFTSHTLMFSNDSGNAFYFSLDGVNDHGRLAANEKLTQDFRRAKRIWFRGTAGSAFRFWAY